MRLNSSTHASLQYNQTYLLKFSYPQVKCQGHQRSLIFPSLWQYNIDVRHIHSFLATSSKIDVQIQNISEFNQIRLVSVFEVKGQGHDLSSFKVIFIKRKCSNTVQFVHTYGSHNKTNIFVKISYPKVKGQGHLRSLKCFSSLFLCKIWLAILTLFLEQWTLNKE